MGNTIPQPFPQDSLPSRPSTQPGQESSLERSAASLPARRPQRRIPLPSPLHLPNYPLTIQSDTRCGTQLLLKYQRMDDGAAAISHVSSLLGSASMGQAVCDISEEGTVPPNRETRVRCSVHGLCLPVMAMMTMARLHVISALNWGHKHH